MNVENYFWEASTNINGVITMHKNINKKGITTEFWFMVRSGFLEGKITVTPHELKKLKSFLRDVK